jgi:mono/diheme cytochrome c family protein
MRASRCMDKTFVIAVSIVAAAFAIVPVSDSASVGSEAGATLKTPLNVALGAEDFETYCASCHGQSGAGDGPVAEYLALEPADLTKLARKNGGPFPRERIAAVIDGRESVNVHGPRDMPVWGDWFNAQAEAPGLRAQERELVVQSRIADLVSYIETIQQK